MPVRARRRCVISCGYWWLRSPNNNNNNNARNVNNNGNAGNNNNVNNAENGVVPDLLLSKETRPVGSTGVLSRV